MQRLIDANALKAKLKIDTNTATYSDYCNGYCDARQVDLDAIDAAPTIEAEPVRHGRWIDVPDANTKVAKCSLCGFWQSTNGDDKTRKHLIHIAVYRYCAGCGARMDATYTNVDGKGDADNG